MNNHLIVCGGRDYDDYERVSHALNKLYGWMTMLIAGGARGADSLAEKWARANGKPLAIVPAQWHFYNHEAGPLRNGWMLLLDPKMVLAFPGGTGTANMISQARASGVRVKVIER